MKKKLIGHLKMLGKLKPRVGEVVSLQLYKSLILPVLDYGDIIYDCLSARDSKRLQTIQNCALRIIKGTDRFTPSVQLHVDQKLLFLSDRRHYHCCNQMFKIMNGLVPKVISDKFRCVEHNRDTRAVARQDLAVPNLHLDLSRRNFTYRGPVHWNFLDLDHRTRPSILSFKINLIKSDHFAPVVNQ